MTVQATDFRDIREWRGSKYQAFEELCYQLRDETPQGAALVKTGNPDGGFEWYITFPDGVQWGWQAKYIFDIDNLLKAMEQSLTTVVQKRPMCRQLTFCIPFDLPDAPSKGQWKSARQKFEDRKVSSCDRIPGADQLQIELWSGGDVLARLVSHPAQRGIERFFWDQEVFSHEWLGNRQEVVTKAVGERYTPELNIDLPVSFALEGLGLSVAFRQRFEERRDDVVTAAEGMQAIDLAGLEDASQIQALLSDLSAWLREVPARVSPPCRIDLEPLREQTRACIETAGAIRNERVHSLPRRENPVGDATWEMDRQLLYELLRLVKALDLFQDLLNSDAMAAASHGALILTGEGGQGKTHLFCDASQRAINEGQPAAVVLAGQMSGRQVWTEMAVQLGLGPLPAEELIGAMEAAASASNAPFLLLVDALNESADPSAWKEELPSLFAELAGRPWIAVTVSVRTTYEPIALSLDSFTEIARVEHPGFRGRELQATERFFKEYGLDHPQVPHLNPEFTNPLFLKLYCEGLKGLGMSVPPAGEDHVTAVFERYLKSKEGRIVSKLKLDPASGPVEAAINAFSQALVDTEGDTLRRDETSRIVNQAAPWLNQWPDTLFGQLLSEGVLTADVTWDPGSNQLVEVVRFTYQRLADYRIGATILDPLEGDAELLSSALANDKSLLKTLESARAGTQAIPQARAAAGDPLARCRHETPNTLSGRPQTSTSSAAGTLCTCCSRTSPPSCASRSASRPCPASPEPDLHGAARTRPCRR